MVFAIHDHPWVDTADGAAVRIAMTVCAAGIKKGSLLLIDNSKQEKQNEDEIPFIYHTGLIRENLKVGIDVTSVVPLIANKNICFQGVLPVGMGFRLTPEELTGFGFDRLKLPNVIKPFYIGRDVVQKKIEKYIIDFFGYYLESAKNEYPQLYQHILMKVKPERDQNRDNARRKNWWLFGRAHTDLRAAISSLGRFIVTVETSKFKPFLFLDGKSSPDHKLYVIASEDPSLLAVLSSHIHTTWALSAGGRLGYGNDPTWTSTTCFLPFPFPEPPDELKARIRELGERLDALRKRQQKLHPGLTITGMYNVLEKLRAGEQLTDKDREINDQGLVSLLKEIHDELDAAVFEAYGWPATLSDEEILERLVALNQERAAEEASGHIRWLRPEYQNPQGSTQAQPGLAGMEKKTPAKAKAAKQPWPKSMAEQAQAVRQALESLDAPASVEAVAKCFVRANRPRVAELLETLVGLGQARVTEKGRYLGV